MQKPLILIGFMGAGKTKVGQFLARRLNLPFFDLDREIERRTGLSIPAFFSQYGEAAFRQVERDILASLFSTDNASFVLATGGGAVLEPENRRRLWAGGTVIYLEASPEEIIRRLQDKSDRPLLVVSGAGNEAVTQALRLTRAKELLARRAPLYEKAHLRVDTTGLTAEEVTEKILMMLNRETRQMRVDLGERSYDLVIANGVLDQVGQRLAGLPVSRKVMVVSNATVSSLYGEKTTSSLEGAGFAVNWALVPDGEEAKTLPWLSFLYDQAVAARLDRRSPVIALGGGVVGDLAGFLAATYLRGVPLVQVPTTLLAQVDSSVGGKVAINHPKGKNLIGAFYQPWLVLIDPATLRTLPTREVRAGLAEVVKYGVLQDESFLEFLEGNVPAILGLEAILPTIDFSCRTKAAIVSLDEKEEGRRAILNFGHTIGHAVEAVTGFSQYRHGEAVAIGMVGASYLAEKRGWAHGLTARLQRLLEGLGLPTTIAGLRTEELLSAMGYDKKALEGRLRLVLPQAVGKMELVEGITGEEITEALKFLQAGPDVP
ncbi:MAG: 3-dehydroquinate synthase [Firmicutes bacterium]|nr:3-dehydroquinate synthase [Bacillota bacterium]MCL5038943.1 3-dehydroquinate synthase [Bacillota bacterium]